MNLRNDPTFMSQRLRKKRIDFLVNKWYELFKDSAYANACLGRFTHRAYRLDFQEKT